jgi:hypothetical protein
MRTNYMLAREEMNELYMHVGQMDSHMIHVKSMFLFAPVVILASVSLLCEC